jgi:hypothetical protein
MTDTPTADACEPIDPVAEEAQAAARNKKVLAKLVTRLSAGAKAERAKAAHLIHEVACLDVQRLFLHVDHLIAALDNPEPQTRWEVLGALEEIASRSAKLLDKAIIPTTNSLHDEDSSVVRLAAFRVLSIYGSTSIRRSEKVWPLLDEALRCYHGDSEYPGMLTALALFVDGRAPKALKLEAGALVEPDASHPKAAIARGARRVFAIASGGKAPQRRIPGGMSKAEPDKPAKDAKEPPAKKKPPAKKPAAKKMPAKKAPGKKK